MLITCGRPGIVALGVALLTAGQAGAQELPWRTDYAAARQEAAAKGRPLLLDFGTANCFWCRKLDQTTFRDAAVARLMSERFVLLKADGDREVKLVQALGVRSYPTLVFAAPDGRILGKQEGYLTVPQLSNLLDTALAAAGAGVVTASAVAPVGERERAAQALLAAAREDFRANQFVTCLERCRMLGVGFADLPEGAEARRLAEHIRQEPELALRACADLSDRLAELYLGVAEGLLRQGRAEQATPYLERVLQVSPDSRHAQTARQQLARLQPQSSASPPPRPPSP